MHSKNILSIEFVLINLINESIISFSENKAHKGTINLSLDKLIEWVK